MGTVSEQESIVHDDELQHKIPYSHLPTVFLQQRFHGEIVGTMKWLFGWWNFPSTKGRQFPFGRCGRGMPSYSKEA